MVNLAILGSCITRDAFNSEWNINNYFARTSIISLVSNALPVDDTSINLSSSFQKRCIKHDLDKDFLRHIDEKSLDCLIIDFIDERFNLLKVNDRIITKSNELVSSGLMNQYEFKEIKRDDNLLPIWEESAKIFFTKLLEKLPTNKIIIHKSYWKSKYFDEYGEIKEFTNQKELINTQNKFLNFYYQFIEENFPEIIILDMTTEEFFCTANHKWGLSPYHFEDNYYHIFLQKLNKIMNNEINTTRFDELSETIKTKSEILYKNNSFVHVFQNEPSDIDKLSFAYYVKFKNGVLYKQWYAQERKINYKPIEKGEYEIVIFMRELTEPNNVKYFVKKLTI